MEFLKNLYLGERVAPNADQILKKLNKNEVVPNVYVLTMATNPDNMMDLIPEWELMQKNYPKDLIRIIGIAYDKNEAIELMQFIVEEAYQTTGSADAREYLKEKWEGQA